MLMSRQSTKRCKRCKHELFDHSWRYVIKSTLVRKYNEPCHEPDCGCERFVK